MITAEQFKHLFPRAQDPASWVESMNNVFPNYDINTPHRIAAFLAQCGHESGGWTVFEENLNYSAQGLNGIFKKYFPTLESAQPYARKPEMIANKVYGGRMGNGPESSGDGYKYRGRGLVQLTGRANYTQCSRDLFGDECLVDDPDLVCEPEYAILSACWFWHKNRLNDICDRGDVVLLSKRINGGTIGLADRIHHWNKCLELFE